MKRTRSSRLDRLFARASISHQPPYLRDAWQPQWKPRGRWWMRGSSRGSHAYNMAPDAAWRRMLRRVRAA